MRLLLLILFISTLHSTLKDCLTTKFSQFTICVLYMYQVYIWKSQPNETNLHNVFELDFSTFCSSYLSISKAWFDKYSSVGSCGCAIRLLFYANTSLLCILYSWYLVMDQILLKSIHVRTLVNRISRGWNILSFNKLMLNNIISSNLRSSSSAWKKRIGDWLCNVHM